MLNSNTNRKFRLESGRLPDLLMPHHADALCTEFSQLSKMLAVHDRFSSHAPLPSLTTFLKLGSENVFARSIDIWAESMRFATPRNFVSYTCEDCFLSMSFVAHIAREYIVAPSFAVRGNMPDQGMLVPGIMIQPKLLYWSMHRDSESLEYISRKSDYRGGIAKFRSRLSTVFSSLVSRDMELCARGGTRRSSRLARTFNRPISHQCLADWSRELAGLSTGLAAEPP